MPSLTDQEVVAACLEGRESAFALLVERYTPRLYRIAARICRNPQDVEDAVQESFLQAVRDLRNWKPTAPLEAWLVTITVRTARKVDQRSSRVANRSDSLDAPLRDGNQREYRDLSHRVDPAFAAIDADVASKLAMAIASLPDKYQLAVTLRFQEDLSPKEIAAQLGIPERTVRTHLLRGLRALRERVGGIE